MVWKIDLLNVFIQGSTKCCLVGCRNCLAVCFENGKVTFTFSFAQSKYTVHWYILTSCFLTLSRTLWLNFSDQMSRYDFAINLVVSIKMKRRQKHRQAPFITFYKSRRLIHISGPKLLVYKRLLGVEFKMLHKNWVHNP